MQPHCFSFIEYICLMVFSFFSFFLRVNSHVIVNCVDEELLESAFCTVRKGHGAVCSLQEPLPTETRGR